MFCTWGRPTVCIRPAGAGAVRVRKPGDEKKARFERGEPSVTSFPILNLQRPKGVASETSALGRQGGQRRVRMRAHRKLVNADGIALVSVK